jgi:hypothetical protein
VSLLPLARLGVEGAEAVVAVRLQRAHAKLLGQGEGLAVVRFGLLGVGGIGVGMEDAKLVQCARLAPAVFLLPGQVERLVGVVPGLIAVSHQTTDLAKPCDPVGKT